MTKADVRANVLMGEALLGLGRLGEARREFAAAGHTDGLIAVGEKALEGWLEVALAAFQAAGHYDGLIAYGRKLLEQCLPEAARGAFKEAAVAEQRGATS